MMVFSWTRSSIVIKQRDDTINTMKAKEYLIIIEIQDQTRVDRDKPRNSEFGLLKHFFDNVLLEHDGLTHVFPHAAHLDFLLSR